MDISTGDFAATQLSGENATMGVVEELARLEPREVLLPATWVDHGVRLPPGTHVTPQPDFRFEHSFARQALLDHFQVSTLDGFGLQDKPLAVRAAGAILAYLQDTQRGALDQLTTMRSYSTASFMTLDAATRRNLELTETIRDGGKRGSLLDVLDRTVTPMGARLLRTWIGQPLLDRERLEGRLDAVEALYGSGDGRAPPCARPAPGQRYGTADQPSAGRDAPGRAICWRWRKAWKPCPACATILQPAAALHADLRGARSLPGRGGPDPPRDHRRSARRDECDRRDPARVFARTGRGDRRQPRRERLGRQPRRDRSASAPGSRV